MSNLVTITHYTLADRVTITRYDRPKRERIYKSPSHQRLAALAKWEAAYGASRTENNPHWYVVACSTDDTHRRHMQNLAQRPVAPEELKPWEINEEIYQHALGELPPLQYVGNEYYESFYASEFYAADITLFYFRLGSRYYCQWARYSGGRLGS